MSVDEERFLTFLAGPSDPLPSLVVLRDQVISAHMGGRIGVYNLQDQLAEVRFLRLTEHA